MAIPYDVILRISVFIDSRNDLHNFLIALGLMDQYDHICKHISDYYINELLPNDDVDAFLDIEEFPEGAYPDEVFPTVATNEYTLWCSRMVKEYI